PPDHTHPPHVTLARLDLRPLRPQADPVGRARPPRRQSAMVLRRWRHPRPPLRCAHRHRSHDDPHVFAFPRNRLRQRRAHHRAPATRLVHPRGPLLGRRPHGGHALLPPLPPDPRRRLQTAARRHVAPRCSPLL